MDQLPRSGKRELICLLLYTCNYVVSVRRGFLFLVVFGMGCVIFMSHSLSLPYYYLEVETAVVTQQTKGYVILRPVHVRDHKWKHNQVETAVVTQQTKCYVILRPVHVRNHKWKHNQSVVKP